MMGDCPKSDRTNSTAISSGRQKSLLSNLDRSHQVQLNVKEVDMPQGSMVWPAGEDWIRPSQRSSNVGMSAPADLGCPCRRRVCFSGGSRLLQHGEEERWAQGTKRAEKEHVDLTCAMAAIEDRGVARRVSPFTRGLPGALGLRG
eukprot:767423-Hanusia_phi.AAC.5